MCSPIVLAHRLKKGGQINSELAFFLYKVEAVFLSSTMCHLDDASIRQFFISLDSSRKSWLGKGRGEVTHVGFVFLLECLSLLVLHLDSANCVVFVCSQKPL